MDSLSKPSIILQKERDFGNVINASFSFLVQEFKTLFKVLLFYVAPFILVSAISSAMYQVSLFENTRSSLNFLAKMFSPQYFVTLILSLISNVMFISAMYSYFRLYRDKGKGNFSVEDVWDVMKTKIFTSLGVSIIVGLIVVVGIILLIVPGIYLGIVLSLIFPVLFFEEKDFSESFKRCFFLIKDAWWRTFGLLIIAYLMVAVAGFIFMLPQSILSITHTLHSLGGKSGDTHLTFIIVSTLGTLCATLLHSVTFSAISFQYFTLVEEKESPSLEDKINNIILPE